MARQPKRPRLTYIACDASYDTETGFAALAACAPGRPLAAKIVRAANACEAERMAILMAMDRAAGHIRCAEFRCDAVGAVSRIESERDPDPITGEIRRRLKKPPMSGWWEVARVKRSEVHAAHTLASMVWDAFVAGKAVVIGGVSA
jgi:hypothetical protein